MKSPDHPIDAPSNKVESLRVERVGSDRELRSKRGGAVSGTCAEGLFGPAFTHVSPVSMPLPVLIAVPHAGRVYPSDTLAQMRDAHLSQLRLEDRYVDKLAVEIAKATGTGLLVAHAPRAMIDLNRAHDDVDWNMISGPTRRSDTGNLAVTGVNHRARSGLGLVPRRLPGFGDIWCEKLSRDELDRRVDRIHRPYHTFLSNELERIRAEWGAALLVDLHSMPPLRRQNGQQAAPQIVLGDRFGASCQHSLTAGSIRYLERSGCPVAHNRPYSGGYVLDRHGAPSRGVHALQIEVCRGAYLDEWLSEPSDALPGLAQMIAGLVRELGAQVAHLAANGETAQAAE
ncbi:N-formylglutamate amidohydrolase [Erythrobacter rubeus]|uniref:N-formylglutamate amidohydrolase n=1 Tax=Erythrobacter rubeus TaxID=2760803 RepID=A0ABR8KM19_9SPHN|nr:N-formylglutamate amidohydrolase [Erythrobacter rubeus]MBD2841517.1 N-formylglutamate amidohydrolase [Erythrobacter rubeus]